MTAKRDAEAVQADTDDSDEVNGNGTRKRARTSSSNASSNGANHRSLQEQRKLLAWLTKPETRNTPVFPVWNLKVSRPTSIRETLTLDGHDYGESDYVVRNLKQWNQLGKYRQCTVANHNFRPGDCIIVHTDAETVPEGFTDDTLFQWKAQIQEIRAFDPNNVFIRIAWLNRPWDLPDHQRQVYHGHHELFPSNYIDVVDAKSIVAPLQVRYWDERAGSDDLNPDEYYWRASYDLPTETVTACHNICICGYPQHPDQRPIQCPHCSGRMHPQCIATDRLSKYLGVHPTDRAPRNDDLPHVALSAEGIKHEDIQQANVKVEGIENDGIKREQIDDIYFKKEPSSHKGSRGSVKSRQSSKSSTGAATGHSIDMQSITDSVTMVISPPGHGGNDNFIVIILDARQAEVKQAELAAMCLLCGHSLDL